MSLAADIDELEFGPGVKIRKKTWRCGYCDWRARTSYDLVEHTKKAHAGALEVKGHA